MIKTRQKDSGFLKLLAASTLLMLVSSCNIYRYVPPDDHLFAGSKITFDTRQKKEKDIKAALLAKAWPVPNKRILGIPFSLISYSISKPPTGKGINYWLHEKIGSPPVLLSQANPAGMRRRMVSQMKDLGYLNAEVRDSVMLHKRKGYINFRIQSGTRYTIDTLIYLADSSELSKAIAIASVRTFLKRGEPFTLDLVTAERERIDLELRNEGYFYFTPDFLILAADTNHINRVYASIIVKPGIPDAARHIYSINNFTIYSDYSSDRDSILHTLPARQDEGFKHVDPLIRFKPVLFRENIVMKEGDLYKYKDYRTTIQRMVNLNNFKFINTTFTPADSTGKRSLDASLFLTPYARRSLQSEIGAYTKSNNYAGTEIKLKITNRNLLHTADHIEVNVSAGFEFLIRNKGNKYYSNQNLAGSLNFYTPHFYLPFRTRRSESEFIPINKISASAEYLRKPTLYTMRSLRLSYGYIWKSGRHWDHSFDPLVINLVNPTNITPQYDSTLAADPTLAKSFEKQFIVGGEYTLDYSDLNSGSSFIHFFNSFTVNLSGNLLSLFYRNSANTEVQNNFFGIPYAQYSMASNDFRVYIKPGQRSTWVNRLFFGYGFAYGNSEIMPYIKQFFTGGSNSLRAFRNGTLGPGSYTDSLIKTQAVQAGEVKFEYNSEFRYKLMKYLSPAAFIDVGNIWYRKEQTDMPGSGFSRNWIKELAVDAGLGLRIDANIMVIRLDVAIPLRIPSLPADQRWVVNEVNMGSKQWRKENVVLNIAFGYPF